MLYTFRLENKCALELKDFSTWKYSVHSFNIINCFFTSCFPSLTELAGSGVRVNAVNPGVIVTELQKRGGLDDEAYAAFLERSKTTHALGTCVVEAVRVARVICWPFSSDFRSSRWRWRSGQHHRIPSVGRCLVYHWRNIASRRRPSRTLSTITQSLILIRLSCLTNDSYHYRCIIKSVLGTPIELMSSDNDVIDVRTLYVVCMYM